MLLKMFEDNGWMVFTIHKICLDGKFENVLFINSLPVTFPVK